MLRKRFAVCAALLLILSQEASAQEKSGVKEGFALKPGAARIVLMRPTIRVGEMSTGGMFEPNADWTAQARENIERELRSVQEGLGNEVVSFDESSQADARTANQYSRLFGAVADSVIEYQFFPGNRLETKKRQKNALDWGVGTDLGKLRELEGADYALFINTHDAYGSTGRKMLQFVGAFAGVSVNPGVHKGHAGLIDLKTGELVWLNADLQMGGDPRTQEGAKKRVGQLLEGFPGRPGAATQTAN